MSHDELFKNLLAEGVEQEVARMHNPSPRHVRLEGLESHLRRVLEARFGALSAELESVIASKSDPNLPEQAIGPAGTAPDANSFLEQLQALKVRPHGPSA